MPYYIGTDIGGTFTGLRHSVQAIVNSAIRGNVDVVGLSILSGAHVGLTRKVIEGLNAANAGDKTAVAGGLILKGDEENLKEMGVKAVFASGTPQETIKEYFQNFQPTG